MALLFPSIFNGSAMADNDDDSDTAVELVSLEENAALILHQPTQDGKKEIELLRYHFDRIGTGVLSLQDVFRRDFRDPDERMRYEGYLADALEQCKMDRVNLLSPNGKPPSFIWGIVERECKALLDLIQFLEYWGPKTQKNPRDYTLDHHEAACSQIEGILAEHVAQVNSVERTKTFYIMTEDYHVITLLEILKRLKGYWPLLTFNRKCRLSDASKELREKVMKEPPTEEQKCDCCIL